MKTSDFDFQLPPERIATHPAPERDASRLMRLDRTTGEISHHRFFELIEFLRPGDCLVMNDSRVIPARIRGRRAKGGQAEIFLIQPMDDGRWRAWVKPARKLPAGSVVRVGEDFEDEVVIEEEYGEGERLVRLPVSGNVEAFLERYGEMPLPPYILSARKTSLNRELRRAGEDADIEEFEEAKQETAREDNERYQTVYARESGSVAAPTAGLHFTEELLEKLKARGVETHFVTLHVGPGTFVPVKTDDPLEHPMHEENFFVSEAEARAIQTAIADPARRVIAVGTTSVRVLESLMSEHGAIKPGPASTRILILPGYKFRAVDALITNFHLPRSTLLMLVSALAGRESILDAYAQAIEQGYRFYSYGDAMLIE